MLRALALTLILALPAHAKTISLLPLGDSRVAGANSHISWRYPLWHMLAQSGCTIDFTGPFNGPAYRTSSGGTYDADHAGVGGLTSRTAGRVLNTALRRAGAPDVAILSLGGNDLLRNAQPARIIARIDALITRLRAANPNVGIILERIPPAHPTRVMTPKRTRNLRAFNDLITRLANTRDTPQSRVIAISAYQGWTGPPMLADPLHYNLAGARHVAAKYHTALTQTLGICR